MADNRNRNPQGADDPHRQSPGQGRSQGQHDPHRSAPTDPSRRQPRDQQRQRDLNRDIDGVDELDEDVGDENPDMGDSNPVKR